MRWLACAVALVGCSARVEVVEVFVQPDAATVPTMDTSTPVEDSAPPELDSALVIDLDALAPVDSGAVVDTIPMARPTRSYLLPSKAPSPSGWARPITLTIASEEWAAIRWAQGEACPSPPSWFTSAPPVEFTSAPLSICWFADNGAPEAVQTGSLFVPVDASQRATYGAIAEKLRFALTDSAVVVARSGDVVAGTVALQAWAGTGSSSNVQVVFGIAGTSSKCVNVKDAPTWPGKTTTVSVTISLPSVPGLYDLAATAYPGTDCTSVPTTGVIDVYPTHYIGKVRAI